MPWDPHAHPLTLTQRTLVHDLESSRDVLLIEGVVVLPVGAEVELHVPGTVEGNVNAPVERVRLLSQTTTDGPTVCLDVRVPASWWDVAEGSA